MSSVGSSRPTFFRRRFAPLIAAWVLALIVAALFYWLERSLPALHEVIIPLYWIIAALIVLATLEMGPHERKGGQAREGPQAGGPSQPPNLSF